MGLSKTAEKEFQPDFDQVRIQVLEIQAFTEGRKTFRYGDYISGLSVREDASELFEQARTSVRSFNGHPCQPKPTKVIASIATRRTRAGAHRPKRQPRQHEVTAKNQPLRHPPEMRQHAAEDSGARWRATRNQPAATPEAAVRPAPCCRARPGSTDRPAASGTAQGKCPANRGPAAQECPERPRSHDQESKLQPQRRMDPPLQGQGQLPPATSHARAGSRWPPAPASRAQAPSSRSRTITSKR